MAAVGAKWDAEKGVWVGDRAVGVPDDELPDPLYVFGYGSLCWRIDDPYEELFDGKVLGWRRRFAQGSCDHRGTPEYPGVVATLMPEAEWLAAGLVLEDGDEPVTNGVVYRVPKADAKRVIDNLDFREKGGYTKAVVDAASLDGSRTVRALIYTANSSNPLFMGEPESLGCTAPAAVAERIHRAVGPSGPNCEYLFKMDEYLRKVGAIDSHVAGLAQQVKALQRAGALPQAVDNAHSAADSQPSDPADAEAVARTLGQDGATYYCGGALEPSSGGRGQQLGERRCGPRDGPQCGCCRAFPCGLMRGQPLEFPEHWGQPPMLQTCDLVILPGGGMGSGTLLRWIERMIRQDEHSEGAAAQAQPEQQPAAIAATATTGPSGGTPVPSSASTTEADPHGQTDADADADAEGEGEVEGELIVAVGSQNPVKLEATRRAFQSVFTHRSVRVVGVNAASGVPDQPFGDEETKRGAMNRATQALRAVDNASFGAGLEGGLSRWDADYPAQHGGRSGMEVFAWMAVTCRIPTSMAASPTLATTTGASNTAAAPAAAPAAAAAAAAEEEEEELQLPAQENWGCAKTASFELPSCVAELIVEQGMELGDADDVIFKRTNSKQGSGVVGILSASVIDRTEYYVQPMVLALIPFINPTIY